MKRTWFGALAVAVVASLSLAALSVGQEKDKKAEPINDKCPISGKDVSADASSDVKVAFCCNNCKGKFEKDPTKSLGKIDKLPNVKCPLSGRDSGDASASVAVAFCCGKCKEKFDKEPEKYLGKVKAKEKKDK